MPKGWGLGDEMGEPRDGRWGSIESIPKPTAPLEREAAGQVIFWRRASMSRLWIAPGWGRGSRDEDAVTTDQLEKKRPRSSIRGHHQHGQSHVMASAFAARVASRKGKRGLWLLHVDPMGPRNGTWCLLSAHQRPTGATAEDLLFVKSFLDGRGGVHEKRRARV